MFKDMFSVVYLIFSLPHASFELLIWECDLSKEFILWFSGGEWGMTACLVTETLATCSVLVPATRTNVS